MHPPCQRSAQRIFRRGSQNREKGIRALFFPQKQADTQRFRAYAFPQLGIPFLQEGAIPVAGFAAASSREDRSIPITLLLLLPLPLAMIEVNEEMSERGAQAPRILVHSCSLHGPKITAAAESPLRRGLRRLRQSPLCFFAMAIAGNPFASGVSHPIKVKCPDPRRRAPRELRTRAQPESWSAKLYLGVVRSKAATRLACIARPS